MSGDGLHLLRLQLDALPDVAGRQAGIFAGGVCSGVQLGRLVDIGILLCLVKARAFVMQFKVDMPPTFRARANGGVMSGEM